MNYISTTKLQQRQNFIQIYNFISLTKTWQTAYKTEKLQQITKPAYKKTQCYSKADIKTSA